MKINQPKILIYDLEVSPAVAYLYDLYQPVNKAAVTQAPSIISIGYKWYGETESKVLSVNKIGNDSQILKEFAKIYAESDITIAYNGDGFDVKHLNTRLMLNELDPLPQIRTIDPLKLVRKNFKFLSNSLEYVAKQLGIEEKGKIPWSVWQACIEGDKRALKEIVEYNRQDIIVLEQLFDRILPFTNVRITPKEKGVEICRRCGSHDLQKRGFLLTVAGSRKQRYKCNDCGTWMSN